ncbi:MAG: metallophosphoesterase [Desulfobacterales bacterium]
MYEVESVNTFPLTLVHVNDTHSHLDKHSQFESERYNHLAGSGEDMPAVRKKVKAVRSENLNTLVLHAGDAVQGTLYFTKYEGEADFALLNAIGFDAMVTGNHEFDKGPELLSDFIDMAQFPIIAANMDVSNEPFLAGKIPPYIIKKISGTKVGIIGLITPETAVISSPGSNITFLDEISTARQKVEELESQGINKIIVLSHMGYEEDIALAEAVEGIDVIVGGHSHTLLGNVQDLGLSPAGLYPTRVYKKSGQDVCIVQSWEWAKAAGLLDLRFDDNGHIRFCRGNAVLLAGDNFQQRDANGNKADVSAEVKNELLAFIADHPAIEVLSEDADISALLLPYTSGIKAMNQEFVAQVAEDLLHIRVPGTHTSGAELSNGSLVAPLVAEGMLWKAKSTGLNVQMSLQNAGGVRIDIVQGDLTVGKCYELLPFGNTLYILELSGAEIKAALQNGVTRGSGAFPYVGGARYTVIDGQVTDAEIRNASGEWEALDDDRIYLIATNAYLAGGGDGYTVLAQAAGYRYDTGFGDAEVFMEYAEMLGTLHQSEETGVIWEPALQNLSFAVFSDPHYYDTALGTSGAAFEAYLAQDRKMLREGPAILDAVLTAITADNSLDFVLIPGDLTKDGELSSHQEFAEKIRELEKQGLKVYVIPGNHDVNNPHAYAYTETEAVPTDSVSPETFAQIYGDFGYNEALYQDTDSLSYIAEPSPGLWLFALDSCRYSENLNAGTSIISGRFSESTLNWIITNLEKAQIQGKKVMAMMHHGLLEHFTGQSQANPGSEYVIENWGTVSETLAKAGLSLVFTGHFHAQDITSKTWESDGKSYTLTDVETGSLVTYPSPFRKVTRYLNDEYRIESENITEISYDTAPLTFPEYAEDYLESGLYDLAWYSLTLPAEQGGYGVSAQQAQMGAPLITAAFKAHYMGNENPSAETFATITAFMGSSDPTTLYLGQTLSALWTDLEPDDLEVVIGAD